MWSTEAILPCKYTLAHTCNHFTGQRVPTDLESPGINLVGEFCWRSGKNDVYRPSCMTVVYFFLRNENAHSVHVITKWWWKGVGAGKEEPTKDYIKLVLAPQMGQGMPNTVMREFHSWYWVGTLGHLFGLPVKVSDTGSDVLSGAQTTMKNIKGKSVLQTSNET